IVEFSCSTLAGKLLPVLDSFDRGLASARASQDFRGMLEGFELIRKQIWEVLQQEGLQALAAKGRTFNPSEHEAVMQEETEEYPDDTVIEELQKGYKFKSRVLRPALVKVARGGKKKEEMEQSLRDKEDMSDG
ncbi:MAG: nucleotide exchange factor GrpE, partial [Armatimonadetes bacterium]|nr:nucleotide exchange factor GrpE [Armatimonadota bacterium]